MTLSIEHTGQAAARVPQVWAALSDVSTWPQWLPSVTAVTAHEPGRPAGVGAAYQVIQPRLGGARWEITEWQPGRGFTWVSRRPGVATTATHELVDSPDGTQIRLGITWAGPAARLVRWLYGGITARYLATEVAALGQRAQRLADGSGA